MIKDKHNYLFREGRIIPKRFHDVCNRDMAVTTYRFVKSYDSTHGLVFEYGCENCHEMKRVNSGRIEELVDQLLEGVDL